MGMGFKEEMVYKNKELYYMPLFPGLRVTTRIRCETGRFLPEIS